MQKKFVRKYGFLLNKKIGIVLLHLLVIAAMILYIEPSNIFIIVTLLLLVASEIFTIVTFKFSKKVAIIAAIGIFFLGLLKALSVLDLVNIAILASFITALTILIYQK